MNSRKKRIRQLAREHREEAERARLQMMDPKATKQGEAPASAPR